MRIPRRLGHEEHAELVDHLDELRSRVRLRVAYTFHGRLIDWLNAGLPPEHRKPITLGIAEPFTTSLTVSLAAGLALAATSLLAAGIAFARRQSQSAPQLAT